MSQKFASDKPWMQPHSPLQAEEAGLRLIPSQPQSRCIQNLQTLL
jgi:hypothetical protein